VAARIVSSPLDALCFLVRTRLNDGTLAGLAKGDETSIDSIAGFGRYRRAARPFRGRDTGRSFGGAKLTGLPSTPLQGRGAARHESSR
jgi:hypothetical protein